MDALFVSGSFPINTVWDFESEQQCKQVQELSFSVDRLITEKRDNPPERLYEAWGLP